MRVLLSEDPDAGGEGFQLPEGPSWPSAPRTTSTGSWQRTPGVSRRDLLRRYAREQARHTSPEELQHFHDMAV